MEYSKHQIPFLDILIKRNRNDISMNLFHNPTGTQRCLCFTSSHPNHCKRNNPFCLEQRICTTAENNAEKLKNLKNVNSNLSKYKNTITRVPFFIKTRFPEGRFIATVIPSNPNVWITMKSSVYCLKNNNFSAFHNTNLIQSKRQRLQSQKTFN